MRFLKKNYKILVLISFALMSLIIGYFHEPWSDEAQSWLIARDQTVKDIIFFNASYEGCFPLWILIVKVFISFGLSYEYINIISTLIVVIAMYVFLYKTDIKPVVKVIFPFTFFVFYQYNIIARNYSLLVLAFMILLSLYDKRHIKSASYFALLAFTSMISFHGMLISGCLFFELLVEEILKFKKDKNINKKVVLFSIGLILIYLFEIYVLFPRQELLMAMNFEEPFKDNFLHILVKICAVTTNSFFLFLNIISVVFLSIVWFLVKKHNQNRMAFNLMEILMIIQLFLIRAASHHIGILFLIIIVELLLNKNNKIIEILTVIVLVLYMILNVIACFNEVNGNYSGAKEMAQYIKQIEDFEKEDVYAVGYKTTAILPYFERNIFDNRKDAYYLWSSDNLELSLYVYFYENMNYDTFFKEGKYPKYLLIQNYNLTNKDKKIREKIERSKLYQLKYETEGDNFYKASSSETEGYILYELIK